MPAMWQVTGSSAFLCGEGFGSFRLLCEEDAAQAFYAFAIETIAHSTDVVARDAVLGGIFSERDFIGLRQQAAFAVA